MFQIEHTSNSLKFLKAADNSLRSRIIQKIDVLKNDPVPHDAKKLVGLETSFRIRVGDYRILYKIKWEEGIIIIAKIDKRSKVYK